MRADDENLDLIDAALLRDVDRSVAAAEAALGPALDYARGCPACCVGPFPITSADARRLRRGLDNLRATDPSRAGAIERRADLAAAALEPGFPGDPTTGRLDPERPESHLDAYLDRHAALACPALDLETARCGLYAARPLPCRAHGPSVERHGALLDACSLCVRAPAPPAGEPIDADGLEEALIAEIGDDSETLVAFALTTRGRVSGQ